MKRTGGGLKRSGRLRSVGKNSKSRQDRAARSEYLEANPTCEMHKFDSVCGNLNDRDHLRKPVEPHHIVGGVGGRADETCNLIALCRTCHDAVQHSSRGTLVCLVVKARKGEFDVERLSELRGLNLVELLRVRLEGEPVHLLFEELDRYGEVQDSAGS